MTLILADACIRCPALVACRSRIVWGNGPYPARVMIVGEAPGEDEDETGVPFIGRSGKKLDWMLSLASLKREDVYCTNVIKCWPGPGNPKPKKAEVDACAEYLLGEIRLVQPELVICMGLFAIGAFGVKGALKTLHGHPQRVEYDGRALTVMPMYHPAAYLRNPNLKAQVVQDWSELWKRLTPTPQMEKSYRRGFAGDLPYVEASSVAFDVETERLSPSSNPAINVGIVGFSVASRPDEALYFHRSPISLQRIKPLLEDPAVTKLCHNTKYEYMVLRQHGITLRGYHDTKLLAHLLGYTNTELKDLTYRLLGETAIRYGDVDWGDTAHVVEYGCGDADHTLQLFTPLHTAAVEAGFGRLYNDVELPLVRVVGDMELGGIPVNRERLTVLHDMLGVEVERLSSSLREAAPSVENVNSPVQLRRYLYDELKLPVTRRTVKTGVPATDEATLERHKAHPFVAALLEYRQVSKLLSTYVNRMLEDADENGYIHPQWKQVGDVNEDTAKADWSPVTGRLSSSPNFQNIPARDEEAAKPLRQCIQAPPGYSWLSFDFSQLELRVLAHYLKLLGDDSLARVYIEGRDAHVEMSAMVHAIPPSEVTDTQRKDGKKGNFAIVYGAQVPKLLEAFPWLNRESAAALRRMIFERYPGLLGYMQNTVSQAETDGAVYTAYGRRRLLPKIWSRDRKMRAEAEREAINMPIQGTGADVVKIAMLRVEALYPGAMRAQIHDDLKLLLPTSGIMEAAGRVREAMEHDYDALSVPLKVDVKWGETWGDEHKL